jgi:DNA mismatch repair protein MutS2
MKCVHPNTYQKLGFDEILAYVERGVQSEEAKAAVKEIKPLSDPEAISLELQKVEEFKHIQEFGDSFPANFYISASPLLRKLELGGNWLNVKEAYSILSWLRSIHETRNYLYKRKEEYPTLDEMVNRASFDPSLIRVIADVFDQRGNIKDDATPELKSIRKSIKSTGTELRNTLQRILRKANEENWSTDKEITFRNDRLVIPVKAEAKNKISGFVQDVSQTGNTVFIEPAAALTMNNRLRELQIREQNEIIKILQIISGKIAERLPELMQFRSILVSMDIIRAKARLAQVLNAVKPVIDPRGKLLEIRKGFYPILLLKAQESEMEVVPLSVTMNYNRRIMIISGPNAGGKSVSLKTLGLLQVMLQAGFLIPVLEDSTFRLFDSIYLDIGDEQSVANDLSTYTSHLYQMRVMGDNMSRNSLFLIDEFGSGTDPKQGGSIAEAFLERFVRQGAYGVITTHYGNLKEFAQKTKGVYNGAMEFDLAELKPTYKLVEGMPGRSYAFEMAKRVGVHHSILRNARKKVGEEEIEAENLLKELEKKNKQLSNLTAENKRRQDKLDRLVEKYEGLSANLEKNRKKLAREAEAEARKIIKDANKRIERTIKEIREKQAEKKATLRLRKELEASMPELTPEERESDQSVANKTKQKGAKKKKEGPKKPEVLLDEAVAVDDWVKLKKSDSYGKLVEMQGKRGVVEVGAIRMTVNIKELVKIKPPKENKKNKSYSIGGSFTRSNARMTLEVMGMRAEDALVEVDRFIDEAQMAGLRHLRILHGKGEGILREVIRKRLNDLSVVKKVSDAPVDQGGAGWTLIEMRE